VFDEVEDLIDRLSAKHRTMESHQEIEDQAAAFLARRDGGSWTQVDQAELEQWLTESTARRVGFLRLEAVWDEARRLRALSAGLSPGAVPPPGSGWRRSPFFDSDSSPWLRDGVPASSSPVQAASNQSGKWGRKRLGLVALAATVLCALAVGAYLTSAPRGDRYSTPIGGIASVPLADGSHLTLNTATQVRVELTPQERYIRLEDGEAFFQVANDPNRPFVVEVGNKRAIAVGTEFSVRRTGADMRVVVTEGKVRVESGSPEGAGEASRVATVRGRQGLTGASTEMGQGRRSREVFLTPGNIASVGDDGVVVEQKPLSEAEDDLTWRDGYLTFHDASLADAVAEFNRYNVHKIVIQDPAVAAIRISGSFRALNYKAFVRVLDDGFAIHARSTDDTTTLTR
jgi:transmembrane sensor